MKTVRGTIATALTRWASDNGPYGECRFIKLVHVTERGNLQIDRFTFDKGSIGALSDDIEKAARNDAENAQGGIYEQYAICGYFGDEMSEGSYCKFSLPSGKEGNPMAAESFSEGATSAGQTHQGMRHTEAMARIYTGAISDVHRSLSEENERIRRYNAQLVEQNFQLNQSMQESLDRRAERDMAVFRAFQEEERTNKLIEGLIPAGMMLANAATGRPIFQVDSSAAEVVAAKNFIRSLTPAEMEVMKNLSPEKYMFVSTLKEQVMEQDRQDEARREAASKKAVSTALSNDKAREVIVRQDEQGVPRPAL